MMHLASAKQLKILLRTVSYFLFSQM